MYRDDDGVRECTHFVCHCEGSPDCRWCCGSGHYFEDEFGRTKPGKRYWSANIKKDTIKCECGHSFTVTNHYIESQFFCPLCQKRGELSR
jgi:hypothetical protein